MQILNLVKLIIIAPRMLTFQAMILKCQSEDFTKDIKPDLITIRCFWKSFINKTHLKQAQIGLYFKIRSGTNNKFLDVVRILYNETNVNHLNAES